MWTLARHFDLRVYDFAPRRWKPDWQASAGTSTMAYGGRRLVPATSHGLVIDAD
jgi:hypothetical protein